MSIKDALALATQLWALVRQGIVDKADANKHFSREHGIPLFPAKPKRRRKRGS